MTLSRVADAASRLLVFGTGAACGTPTYVLLDPRTSSQTVKAPLFVDQPRLDQAWFWTPEWQAIERQADADLAAGRYEDFDTIDAFIESLGKPFRS